MIVDAVLVGMAVVGLAGFAMYWNRRRTQAREALYRAIAAERGGSFIPSSSSLLEPTSAALVVSVEHAVVRLDTCVVRHGGLLDDPRTASPRASARRSPTHTRARALFACGSGPEFRVRRERIVSSIGKALGAQDVQLGDRRFDELFVVECDDPEATRAAWSAEARRGMQADRPRFTASFSSTTEVTVRALGALSTRADIDAMLALTGTLASYGARELAALGRALGLELELAPPSEHAPGPARPRLILETPRGRAVARVRTHLGPPSVTLELPHEREFEDFEATLQGGDAKGLPPGLLGERGARLLPPVGDASLQGHRRALTLRWPRVPEPDQLSAGAALLAELAGGGRSLGAFR